ncbi:hypothetical protein ABZ540_12480 [Nocardia xishanensis]|uniref:hypothetical protein n=1 Tax=Nocardia xishanensis TaxID=238964 RepID=UPI0033F07409
MNRWDTGGQAPYGRFARDLQPLERLQLSRAVFGSVVAVAERLSGSSTSGWGSYLLGDLGAVEARELHLSLLRVCGMLVDEVEAWMASAAACAVDHTADLGHLVSVTGVEHADVHRNWNDRRDRDQACALVISQPWPNPDPQGAPTDSHYEQDRGWWRIGLAARRSARYAVVVVDHVIRRVYELDPDGWDSDTTGIRWRFRATGAAALSEARVDAAVEQGLLPARLGDSLPAQLDTGCVPWHFLSAATRGLDSTVWKPDPDRSELDARRDRPRSER